jgi:hypothetical protein
MINNMQSIFVIVLLIVIIVIVYNMNNFYEEYANKKCLENGFKLAFPNKINNNDILKYSNLPNLNYFDGIEDGRYTPLTLSNESVSYLNLILGKILDNINKKTNKKYILRKIDSVNKEIVKQGSIFGYQVDREILTRITVDFFTHELTRQETRRFIVIFTIDNNKNVNVEHFNLSNAYKYNFMSNSCINDNPVNDQLILSDKVFNKINICGVDSSKIEYSLLSNVDKLTSTNNGIVNYNELAVPLFLPQAIHENSDCQNVHTFPNRKHTGWWDENGVSLIEEKGKNKLGIDHGYDKRYLTPYDNPTVAKYQNDIHQSKYHNLFKRNAPNFIEGNIPL